MSQSHTASASPYYNDDPYYISPEEEAQLERDARCQYCDGSGFFYSDPDLGPCNCVLDAENEPEVITDEQKSL